MEMQIRGALMGWVEDISKAINYIENNLEGQLSIDNIAERARLSPFYFQKGFTMLCGFTVSEYIRKRRLTLAGSELVATENKVIDIALKYGYDSPDSFTKAFTRFHGLTPNAVRKGGTMLKSLAPLKLKFSLEGGYIMDYKIVEKEAFTIMGVSKVFKYDNAFAEIPQFWAEHYQTGGGALICGMYGVCIDKSIEGGMPTDEFEYVIADNYNPMQDVPQGVTTKIIPKNTWAVFPCKGALPEAIQAVNRKIFTEWLPNCCDYEIAAGYNIELYTNAAEYPQGINDESYYSEIWVPIKKK